jgi:hypothetical protein
MSNRGQPVIANPPPSAERDGLSTSELLSRLSTELSRLVRSELQLVRVELMRKSKRAGLGFGALSTGGLLAFFAGACLLTAAILGLATAMSPWAAALLVGIVLLIGAGLSAFAGKKLVQHSLPVGLPDEITDNIRADVRTVKEHAKR